MNVDELIDELGTPDVAVLTIGEHVWKFKQATTYAAARKDAKAQQEFADALVSGQLLLPEQKKFCPPDIDIESAKVVYLLHKRCVESPDVKSDPTEPPITLVEALKLLNAPKFIELVERILGLSSYNGIARLLNKQVGEEKNGLSETPHTA